MAGADNLGFGCVSLTQHLILKDALKILSIAFDKGIKHYDTALLYGNGYSEKILGRFIKDKRDAVTITTKFGLGNLQQPNISISIALALNRLKNKIKKPASFTEFIDPVLTEFRSISLNYIQQSLNKSLKNLKTDFIDYYLLHEALPSFLTQDAIEYLLIQKEKKIIRNLGVAAGYVNLFTISKCELNNFDVMQYENSSHYKSDEICIKFPDKQHFYHSLLKSIPFLNTQHSKSELAGILLSRACKINPSGKVLFSTTSTKRLEENLKFFTQFNCLSLDELNNLYIALH